MMNSNRREFLVKAGVITSLTFNLPNLSFSDSLSSPRFNMSGNRAQKIDKVRIAVIGLGMRGPGAVDRLSYIEGTEIVALCDKHADRVNKAQRFLPGKVCLKRNPIPVKMAGKIF